MFQVLRDAYILLRVLSTTEDQELLEKQRVATRTRGCCRKVPPLLKSEEARCSAARSFV